MNSARNLYGPFFRWARRRRIIPRSPMADFGMPTSKYVPEEHVPPEIDQLCLYLSTAVEVVPDVAPVLTLDAVTGMRRGEIVAIRRSSVFPERSYIKVEEAVDDHGLKLGAGLLGTDARSVPDPAGRSAQGAPRDRHRAAGDDRARGRSAPPVPAAPGASADRERGPAPKGGMSFKDIGQRLGRTARWAQLAVESALRREDALRRGPVDFFDGSITALRKFTSSELLDAGFNIAAVADRQGHTPEVRG